MMATSFGYQVPRFGVYAHSPGQAAPGSQRSLTSALAGGSPLQSRTSGYGGYTGYQALNPSMSTPTPAPPKGAAAPQVQQPQAQQPSLPTPGVYDLNTDPILQQIQAFTGMGDQQANSAALKQKQQLLLGYGDQGLAQQVLGPNDPTAQAAAQSLTSILAQLAQQHQQISTNYENQLDPSLFYSGARVLGEQGLTRDYQNALAGAGQNVQGGLDQISGNLAQALAQNQQQRIQAANDAYQRALQEALANPPTAAPPSAGMVLPQVGSGSPFTGGAPGGTLTGDPEHNAFVQGQSEVDPFAVQANPPRTLASALSAPSPVAQQPDPMSLLRVLLRMA